jgi:hypothetical protein
LPQPGQSAQPVPVLVNVENRAPMLQAHVYVTGGGVIPFHTEGA